MKSENGFLYGKAMREARGNFRSMGLSLFLFMAIFGIIKTFVFFPVLGRLWGLVLMTSPEGYISNANILTTLVKSPWVILIGLMLVAVIAMFALWQFSAMAVGICYMRKGVKIRLSELLRLSVTPLRGRFKAENLMLPVYSLIIVPMADVYQTCSMIKAFAVPDFIMDFIAAKPALFAVYVVLMAFIVYIALRWMFLLPSFILKRRDFGEARKESCDLTAKCWLKNGINTVLYSFVEYLRLSLLPAVIIMLPVFVCYLFTKQVKFAPSIYATVGVSWGLELVKTVTASLLQLSITYLLVGLYFSGTDEGDIALEELKGEDRDRVSVRRIYTACCCILALALAVMYLGTLKLALGGNEAILDIFGKTEIIAHKGYSSKAPENTMPAFELAAKCGDVSCIELDVWSTKDGVPVVIHNSTITDATGVDRYVYDCTYSEIKDLPAPYAMPPEDFPDARIPSLEEVIARYANSVPLLIEIKGFGQDSELSAKIVELLRRYDCEYTNLIQSGDYGALRAVKKIDPKIKCGLILAIVTGDYYDLPYADFFNVEQSFVDSDTVSALHRHGKKLFAWTVNDGDDAYELNMSGADAVITDEPEELADALGDTDELVKGVLIRNTSRMLNIQRGKATLINFEQGNY